MKLRAAILGYGRSGSTMHAGAIEESDAFELVAACDIDPERRRQAVERFGCRVYEDYHALLREMPLDLVCVVTRSDQHCRMTCDCLNSGVNVLVTKPWAANAAEARQMMACAEKSGALLLPWLPSRWGAALTLLRERIGQGVIGNVFMVRRTVTGFASRSDWQTQRQHAGGYLLNWGPHIVDPALVLMGNDVRTVYGRMKQVINPGDTEDLFMAVMTLANGTLVTAEYTLSPVKHPDWFIQGDQGAIVVHGKQLMIHQSHPKQPADPTKFSTMQAVEDCIHEETFDGDLYGNAHHVYAEIAAALRRERVFAVQPEDALRLSRVLDAIRESDARNEVVGM